MSDGTVPYQQIAGRSEVNFSVHDVLAKSDG